MDGTNLEKPIEPVHVKSLQNTLQVPLCEHSGWSDGDQAEDHKPYRLQANGRLDMHAPHLDDDDVVASIDNEVKEYGKPGM